MRLTEFTPSAASVITEGKGHLDHPEDMVFLGGGSGAKQALDAIGNTIDNPKAVTIKWDGYPALIFGRDSQGRFSIMDKHMFNKKDGTGRQVYSPKEFIEYDTARGADRSNLHNVIARIWPGLEAETTGSGYYWGDLLFFQPLKPVDGKFVFKANPNGIRYEVNANSQIGKLIAGKQAAIAVHQYIAADAPSTDDAVSLNGTIGNLKNTSNVAIVPSAMPNAPLFDWSSIKPLVAKTRGDIAKYGTVIDQLMNEAPQARNTFNNLFTVYINKKIVSGDLSNLVGDFYKFFETRPMTDAMRGKLTQHLQANKKGIEGAFQVWIDLYKLKSEVVRQLDLNAKNSPVQGFLQDGTPTQEGFVSQGLKFVDRMGFSRQNLASRQQVAESQQLNEASYREVIRDLLDRFYKDVGLPPVEGWNLGILDIKSPGTRVWTRGDGVRHRDPGYIVPSYWSDEPKKGAVVVQKFWQWLQKQPGVRPLGQISGEFSTSKFSDMVGYKGLYFAGGPRGVEFGSASRFKNPRSVWRHNAPEQALTETTNDRNVVVVFGGGFQPWSPWHTGSYMNAIKQFKNVPGVKFYIATSNSVKERPIPFAEKEFLIRQAGVTAPIVEVKTPLNPKEILSQYDPDRDVFVLVRSAKDPMEYKAKKDGSPGYYQPLTDLSKAAPFGQHGYVYTTPITKHNIAGKAITSASDVRAMYAAANEAQKVQIIKALYPKANDPVGIKDTFDTYLSGTLQEDEATEFNQPQNSLGAMPGIDWTGEQEFYKNQIKKKHRERGLAKFMDKEVNEADQPNIGGPGVRSAIPGSPMDVMYGLPKKISPRKILRKHRSMEKFLGHQFEAASPQSIQSNNDGLGDPAPLTQAATELRPGPNKVLAKKAAKHKREMEKFIGHSLEEADPASANNSPIPGTPSDLKPKPSKAEVRKASAIHQGLEKFFGHKF